MGERGSAFSGPVECTVDTTTPAAGGRYPFVGQLKDGSALIGAAATRGCPSDQGDIGQFAIAKLGQFADIALIVRNAWIMRMSESNMGSLLVFTIQLWRKASSLQAI